MDEKTIARFWAKVDKSGPIPAHRPKLGPCWIWTAGRHRHGYGGFYVMLPNGRNTMAHRFSWFLECGKEAGPLCVLHRCDNPPCVRPSHLFLGTQRENLKDMLKKGRHVVGKVQKFSDEIIRAIRADCGLSTHALAKKYGVSQMHAWNLVNFKYRTN